MLRNRLTRLKVCFVIWLIYLSVPAYVLYLAFFTEKCGQNVPAAVFGVFAMLSPNIMIIARLSDKEDAIIFLLKYWFRISTDNKGKLLRSILLEVPLEQFDIRLVYGIEFDLTYRTISVTVREYDVVICCEDTTIWQFDDTSIYKMLKERKKKSLDEHRYKQMLDAIPNEYKKDRSIKIEIGE